VGGNLLADGHGQADHLDPVVIDERYGPRRASVERTNVDQRRRIFDLLKHEFASETTDMRPARFILRAKRGELDAVRLVRPRSPQRFWI
jgi:hypothetical protein